MSVDAPLRHPGASADCPVCGGLGLEIVRDKARLIATPCRCRLDVCPACEDRAVVIDPDGVMRACTCARVARRARRFDEAGLPGRYGAATLASLADTEPANATAASRVREWAESWTAHDPPPGLVLYGPVGRGKTHFVVAAARTLLLTRGARVRFLEFTHLIADLKAAFDRGEGASSLLDGLGEIDVLVLDELGKGRLTEFEDQMLDDLISRRYNAGLPILATTNYDPREPTGQRTANLARPGGPQPTLGDRVGDRVFSRLREMCRFYPLGGEDDLRTTSRKARW